MKKKFGISLLEVMLSLAIIAIILVMATRYFTIAMRSEKTNEAVKVLQTMMKASDDWLWTYKTYKKTANNPDVSTAALINLGLVPKNYSAVDANPWGGTIDVKPNSENQVTIFLTNVNESDCQNLAAMMQNQGFKQALCAAVTPSEVARFELPYP